jgi:hypothetical protein
MPWTLPRHGRTALAATGLLAALSLSACGGNTPAKTTTDNAPDAQKTQNGTVLHAHWPLTGKEVKGQLPSYPPLVVKFDNTYSSRPQIGLKKADLVTEELVEGGLTRLAAFYETSLPDTVGPVRSMRASDIGVVKPVHATIVTSGAAGPTIARLRGAGVSFRANGSSTDFDRDYGRAAPYNLFVHLKKLAATLKAPAKTPQPYLAWGKEKDFQGVAPAKAIQVRFSPGHTTEWSYRGGKYVNTNSFAAPGTDFRPDTVIVVRVREGDAGYLDPAGNHVPETIYTGSGKVLVFHGGKVLRGTWSKKDGSSALRLTTRVGTVKVPAGHTWIELLPRDQAGGRVSFQR